MQRSASGSKFNTVSSSSDDSHSDDDTSQGEYTEPGDVYAFGYGYYGQLGVDSVTTNIPMQIPNLHRIIRVAAGEAHSLAVSGNSHCTYQQANRELTLLGQLGHGDTAHRKIPTAIEALKSVEAIDVACGTQHSVVLTVDSPEGDVFTFGCGSLGRLGHGDNNHLTSPKVVSSLRGKRILQIGAGNWYTMALSDHGAVFSWGYNRFGQIGHGKASTQLFPRHISSLYNNTIVKICCGKVHSLFWSETGDIYSMGSGNCGQLGTKNRKIQNIPTAVEKFNGLEITSIASGYNHNVALDSNGTVFGWGYFSRDHLGLPEYGEEYYTAPFDFDLTNLQGDRPESVHAGGWHSALITERGDLYTWGCGYRGRLGIGQVDDEEYPINPVRVSTLSSQRVHQVACGGSHTLVIARQNNLSYCFAIQKLSWVATRRAERISRFTFDHSDQSHQAQDHPVYQSFEYVENREANSTCTSIAPWNLHGAIFPFGWWRVSSLSVVHPWSSTFQYNYANGVGGAIYSTNGQESSVGMIGNLCCFQVPLKIAAASRSRFVVKTNRNT
ncbi:putative uvb-resistance protein uvr8 [Planoprotostelium fungivorum]|uniref:Putative uvb-resistance protein uvr8 n=1 Tax=Planoprotostelium fungivorum TaxID=1890364 RepID=A0A2P6NSY0_9EUKA|nr:putative uvb-resistance protein uvr8 [Planoprotostelium fungivorum]